VILLVTAMIVPLPVMIVILPVRIVTLTVLAVAVMQAAMIQAAVSRVSQTLPLPGLSMSQSAVAMILKKTPK